MSDNNGNLYILLISVHGLIRGHDLELGRDADTGGQTKYVVELLRELGKRSEVEQAVLLTRRIFDPILVRIIMSRLNCYQKNHGSYV